MISQNNFDFWNHQIILIFDTTKSILLYHKFDFCDNGKLICVSLQCLLYKRLHQRKRLSRHLLLITVTRLPLWLSSNVSELAKISSYFPFLTIHSMNSSVKNQAPKGVNTTTFCFTQKLKCKWCLFNYLKALSTQNRTSLPFKNYV